MLGPLVLRSAGATVTVEGTRRRALLAALLAHRGRTVGADALAATVWPDAPPADVRHGLESLVSRVRGLGVPVVASDGGYRLAPARGEVDADDFDDLLRRSASADLPDAVRLLEDALGLWRGPAFGAAADLPDVRAEAQRLAERRLQASERLVGLLVAAGRPEDAVALAARTTAEAPGRETAWAAHVRALVAAGRPADGVAAYASAAAALDALGLLPSADLRAAHTEALRAPDVGRAPPAPTRSPPAVVPAQPVPGRTSATIPVPASSLVGRDDDVAAVEALLAAARLVTLVGPGGVGKTRLALEVARRRAAHHASGGRVVELTTLTDPASVPAAVLAAIGVGTQGGPAEAGLHRAGDLDLLVLLDNCEHLLDPVAHVVEALLGGGRARVLATSRERVGVPGEHVHLVAPLPTQGPDPAARRLFLERAAQAGARTDDLDPGLVDRVVRLLDGLPLAIEMAAARSATLALPELAAALGSSLEDGIGLLRDPRRHGAERHRTLRAVIAWSEAVLEPAEHEALVRWPVFAGAVEASDAAAVVGAGRDVVESLVRRSLLVVDPVATLPRTRYRMLRTVASAVQAGWGAPSDADRARHATHHADVAAAADAAVRTSGEAAAVARLTSVVAELRAAHAWARTHDPAVAVRLSRAVHTTAVTTMDDEMLGWAALLGRDGVGVSVAHAAVAARLLKAGELAAAAARAQDALATAEDDADRLHALDVLADAPIYDGRFDECRERAAALRELALHAHDPFYVALAGSLQALCSTYAGDAEAAHAEVAEHRGLLARRFADVPPSAHGWLTYAAGEADVERDPLAALGPLEEALRTADAVGNRYLGGVARVSLASVLARHGDPAHAARTYAEVLRWWLERGDRTHLVTALRNLVDLLVRTGAWVPAAELWAAVAGPAVSPSFGPERERLDRARDAVADALGPERLDAALAAGAARGVEAATEAALDALRTGQSTSR